MATQPLHIPRVAGATKTLHLFGRGIAYRGPRAGSIFGHQTLPCPGSLTVLARRRERRNACSIVVIFFVIVASSGSPPSRWARPPRFWGPLLLRGPTTSTGPAPATA